MDGIENDIAAARAGDESACRRLMAGLQSDVERQMWRFTRDRTAHAELVQDVFVSVFLNLRGYRGDAPFTHWVRRIATTTGYRHWRNRGREERRREALALNSADTVPEPDSPSDSADLLFGLLAQLPGPERLVLTLMYFEMCSIDEIAERTGWSKANVKVRAFRARQKLRPIVENAGIRSPHDA